MAKPLHHSVTYAQAIEQSPKLSMESLFPVLNTRLLGGKIPPCDLIYPKFDDPTVLGQVNFKTRPLIQINPATLNTRTYRDVVSTFVHELCHVYEYAHGPKAEYHLHTDYWTAVMEGCGLMPSNTGAPGGSENGQQMTHYVIRGGPFETVIDDLMAFQQPVTHRTFPAIQEGRFHG